jgi:GTPase Era involved in 16S rRNA processing
MERSVNELMMTANKKKYKDAPLVMLLVDAINPQARKSCIILGVFFFS